MERRRFVEGQQHLERCGSMIDDIANNETGVSVRGKLNDMIGVVNSVSDPIAEVAPVVNYFGITGLTGGGATNLDGIDTEEMDVGLIVAVTLTAVTSLYRLTAGTTAEDSPIVVRPDDYAGGTNEKVWVLLGFTSYSLEVLYEMILRPIPSIPIALFTVRDSSDVTVISLGTDGVGVFTGGVTIGTAPVSVGHATRKDYVDTKAGVRGTLALGNGVSSGSVTGLGLSAPPTAVLLTIQSPVGGGVMSVVLVAAPTTDGFDFALSGMTDTTTYKLHYHVIP